MHTLITTILEFVTFLAVSLGIISPKSDTVKTQTSTSSILEITKVSTTTEGVINDDNQFVKKFEETTYLLGTSTLRDLLYSGISLLEKSNNETLRLQLVSYLKEYSKRVPYDKEMEKIKKILFVGTSTCVNIKNIDECNK